MSDRASLLQVRAFARSDAGKRRSNGDAVLADEAFGLCAVADGMGGQAGGAEASQMAMEALARAVASIPDGAFVLDPSLDNRQRLLAWLGQTVTAISAAIHARAEREPPLRGMGTTLEVALVRGRSVLLAHVGDSRTYVLRDGTLYLLTDDHTMGRMMVARGTATPEEAAVHPQRNVLTRALGVYPDEQADVAFYDLAPGDVLLLCTDGVHEVVPHAILQAALEADPASAADAIVHAALAAGARDNAMAAVLAVDRSGFAGRRSSGARRPASPWPARRSSPSSRSARCCACSGSPPPAPSARARC
jgi:protein phosphatase